MIRVLATIVFLGSILFMPWFVALPFGILLLSVWRERALLIAGAILADALFGIPVPALGGFAFLYTALFALLIIVELMLRTQMID